MAFTTIPGASATDATSFIGTEGVDILSSIDVITALVEGLGSSDTISASTLGLAGFTSLTDWTVRGGTGNDTIELGTSGLGEIGGDVVGGLFNGNQGGDTINAGRVFGGARILGGMDIDTIDVFELFSSSVNGNKAADTVTVRDGIVNGSVFGGQGADTISVGTSPELDGIESSLISGDLGSDSITVIGTLYGSSTIEGGEGNDTIDFDGVIKAAGNDDGLIIIGGVGDDIITAGAPRPATTDTPEIIANDTNDTISGDEGNDTIAAGGGDDTVTGGAGDDNLVVGGDALGITGAGDGIDVVTGGAGADKFWGISAAGGTTDAPTTDHITDFVTGTDSLVDGNGNVVPYVAGGTYATVKELLAATLPAGEFNVAVGSVAAGYSSYIIEVTATATGGTALTGIALLNSIGQYTEAQAKLVAA